MSGKTIPQGASLNQGACGVKNWMAVRPMYKSWLLRHATVRNSIYCGIACPGVYLKKNHLNFVNPHAAILKIPAWGLPASIALRCVTLFNHIDSCAPYSTIYVYILLQLMILCVGVPGLLWSRFNTYNNQCMLYKISQIFCQYIMADFPVLPLSHVHCLLLSIHTKEDDTFLSQKIHELLSIPDHKNTLTLRRLQPELCWINK